MRRNFIHQRFIVNFLKRLTHKGGCNEKGPNFHVSPFISAMFVPGMRLFTQIILYGLCLWIFV